MSVSTDPAGNAIYTVLGREVTSGDVQDMQTMGHYFAPSVATPVASFTVATLPTGLTSAYAIAFATDATATTRLSTPSGGGSNKVLVFTTNNGTAWSIL